MITFERPEMLFLLLIIPLFITIHLISLIYFSKRAFKFANFETLRRLHEQKSVFSKRVPHLLIRLLFIVVVVFAASGVGIWLETTGLSEEVIIAVDSSGSMLASDIEPSRLEATKGALSTFIGNSTLNTRAGLISFTSVGYLEESPTDDKRVLLSAINDLKIRKSRGTSLGEAINFATALMGYETNREKAIIIITDGQENVLADDELVEIAREAKGHKLKIHIIGVGTGEGAAIEEGASGKSVLNEETFKLITKENGGNYVTVLSQAEIVTALENFTKTGTVERKLDLSLWLYMLGFVFLIFEWYLANYIFRGFP